MINVLFSFSIVCMIIYSLLQIITLVHNMNIINHDEDIFIGIKQISKYTLTHNLEVYDDQLNYDEFSIFLDDHRVVKTPGFDIIIFDIDKLNFYKENQKIYVNIQRDDREYKSLINYEI